MSATSSRAAIDASGSRPPTTIDPHFSCGSPQALDSPPRLKAGAASASAGSAAKVSTRAGVGGVGIGRKHLVGDEGEVVRGGDLRQAGELTSFQIRPGGIVRVHDDQRTRAGCARAVAPQGSLDAGEVDVPNPVEGEPIRQGDQTLETRQIVEQRIARFRHQHRFAGVGQQLEEERIRLARARGEHDALCVDGRALARVITGDGHSRRPEAKRRGPIRFAPGAAQGGAQCLDGVRNAHSGRIRLGQIEDLASGTPLMRQPRERVFGRGPSEPTGEHGRGRLPIAPAYRASVRIRPRPTVAAGEFQPPALSRPVATS